MLTKVTEEVPIATINVRREKKAVVDRTRKYKVLIDGEKVGALKNGGSESFEVGAGRHEVMMKVDWCSSLELAGSPAAPA